MGTIILKPFRYSVDGIAIRHAVPGGDASLVPAALVPGLVKEGFLGLTPATSSEQPALPGADPEAPPPAEVSFDPATADEQALRAFLAERGVTVHHRAGIAKLREMAADAQNG